MQATAQAKMAAAADAARAAGERLLGVAVERVDAHRRLKSMRLHMADDTAVATRRESRQRAALEAEVLRLLGTRGAAVPRLLAFDGVWLIQEDLGRRRLSHALTDSDETAQAQLLDAALRSLHKIHMAGAAAGLPKRLFRIGSKPGWLAGLFGTPGRLGRHVGLPAPALSEDALTRLLTVQPRAFVKWDARPANACLRDNDVVAWFDWEHCGCRNRMDDVVWLLGDENVPERPDVERRLLARHVPAFDEGGYPAGAESYLYAFGAFHVCVRMAVLLEHRVSLPGRGLRPERLEAAQRRSASGLRRLCRRGARWASENAETAALVAWFTTLETQLTESRAASLD